MNVMICVCVCERVKRTKTLLLYNVVCVCVVVYACMCLLVLELLNLSYVCWDICLGDRSQRAVARIRMGVNLNIFFYFVVIPSPRWKYWLSFRDHQTNRLSCGKPYVEKIHAVQKRQRVVLKVRAGGSELFGWSEALIVKHVRVVSSLLGSTVCMPDCSFICYLAFFLFFFFRLKQELVFFLAVVRWPVCCLLCLLSMIISGVHSVCSLFWWDEMYTKGSVVGMASLPYERAGWPHCLDACAPLSKRPGKPKVKSLTQWMPSVYCNTS